jgi:hypothetical protein
MERYQGSIIIVISSLGILIVRDSLALPLLAVVGYLNDNLSRQFNLRSYDLESIFADYFGLQFLGRESDSDITQSWLLKIQRINSRFCTALKRTSNRANRSNFSLFVVSELDVFCLIKVFVFPANNLFSSINGNSNNIVVTMRSLMTHGVFVIVV